jgi:mono/diheme cytochrome c family protein
LARSRLRNPRRRAAPFTLALLLAAGGCTQIDNALAQVPVFAFMRSSPAFDPQQNPRPAPPGAVPYDAPLGDVFAPMAGTDPELRAFADGPHGTNPFPVDDPAMLELGRVMYDRHCAVCHGALGRGDGPIIRPGAFPLAPDVVEGPSEGTQDVRARRQVRAARRNLSSQELAHSLDLFGYRSQGACPAWFDKFVQGSCFRHGEQL